MYQKGNQELRCTIANISHDLRTPLAGIRGFSELLEERITDRKSLNYLNIIQKKEEELTILIEELFSFSQAIEDDQRKRLAKVCINDILEEVISSFYESIKKKNITPKITICEEKIVRRLDQFSLIRIFENIISNALKYGDYLIISMNNLGLITFSNHTKYMDRVLLEKIFDRYYTVENGKKRAGLGLAIAKQLVELNGGTIKASYHKNLFKIFISFK